MLFCEKTNLWPSGFKDQILKQFMLNYNTYSGMRMLYDIVSREGYGQKASKTGFRNCPLLFFTTNTIHSFRKNNIKVVDD